ncbi:MAG: EF-hand domain-containing protein [Rhodocyclaceae bacterium]|nr:EF-hand domain-containing protein [Rhodocyclaceae bacterium]
MTISRKTTRSSTLLVAVAGILVPLAALSAPPQARGMGPGNGPQGAMPTFADFDVNGDGRITENEFNEVRGARISKRAQEGYPMRGLANASSFADIDTNHDGEISADEFSAHQASHRQPRRQ